MEPQNARIHREGGQMLVLFVLALGVLMGFVAMTVDVGMILHERRSLQNGADAPALAAVADLPDSPSEAVAAAEDWAKKNGYEGEDGVTITITTPYNGDPNSIEVVIEEEMPFIFARVLGLESTGVGARAVATRDGGPGYGPAIFAAGTGCGDPKEVETSSADIDVVGDIISNGTVKMTGSDIDVEGALAYICDNPQLNTGTFTTGLSQVTEPMDWPVYFDYSDFACDFTIASTDPWEINPSDAPGLYDNPSTGLLKSGVYCHVDDIQVSQGASGKVTFVSREGVYFTGGPYDLTPYQDDVLIYAEKLSTYAPCPYQTGQECQGWDDTAVHISTNSFTFEGIIFAPNGKIQFSSSSVESPSGGLYGNTVKISSSSGSITGLWDEDAGSGAVKLIE